jgi:transitional endoplasmic reticulum ATPase
VVGRRLAHARALPLPTAQRGKGLVLLDGTTRANAGVSLGEMVRVSAVAAPAAKRVLLGLGPGSPRLGPELLRRALAGTPVAEGDTLRISLSARRETTARVAATEPSPGPVVIDAQTEIETRRGASGRPDSAAIRYDDLGGLARVVARIREVVELPMRHPEAFERLGIDPPKGVLLVGPPGAGKTMIARAVAAESGATFLAVNGPEIVDRYYGASEQALRGVFARARENAPAIVFIDGIDAIAPKRDSPSGEKQVERRMVAQLLTLLDGLEGRGQVIVIAATNQAEALDPALRRPGRFDREIRVDPPDRLGRREILAVHCRTMPLAPDVDLDALAEATMGYVAADLAALCREAAMAALRRAGLPDPAAPQRDTEKPRRHGSRFHGGADAGHADRAARGLRRTSAPELGRCRRPLRAAGDAHMRRDLPIARPSPPRALRGAACAGRAACGSPGHGQDTGRPRPRSGSGGGLHLRARPRASVALAGRLGAGVA